MLGCIADDYTGATDLSSMLVRAGLRVVQLFWPQASSEPIQTAETDAVVISLKSRSIPAAEAVLLSLQALRYLQSLGAQRFYFKYCSTFDSTPAGNIGPVAEALADALNVERVWYCPAFPENGRSVYCGNLFVNRVPLHESGMKDHPLNPMTDSNLVRVLQAQTQARVDFLSLDEVQAGDASRGQNAGAARHWIVDALSDADLRQIAQLSGEHVLLTGGSAIARFWAEATTPLRSGSAPQEPLALKLPAGQAVILAGSCSQATRRQIAAFSAQALPVIQLNVIDASATEAAFQAEVERALHFCRTHSESPVLITSSAAADAVIAAVSRLGELRSADLIERLFAAISRRLPAEGVNRIIVAGGETSGAVINALEIAAVRIGDEVAPGVPCVYTLRPPFLALVLKSGNFGSVDFFADALTKLNSSPPKE